MATGLPSDRPLGWPAWCASLVIHAGLLVTLLFLLRTLPVRGAAEQPTREVGIVLKQIADDGPMFVGPDEERDEQANSTENAHAIAASQQMLEALPNPADFPSSESALPKLPTIGPGALTSEQAGDVSQMASGAAPSRGFKSKTTVSVFGISGTGTRFVYVFDRSISMAGTPLRAAKEQLIASLDSLDSIHQFQVIFFNHEPQAWDLTGGQNRIAFASDANKQMAEKFVSGVVATGGTFRRSALQMALRLRPDVIFFLTDTDDPMSGADLTEAIRRARRDSISVNTIEYGSGDASSGQNFLTQLARETGGRYVYVDTQQLGR